TADKHLLATCFGGSGALVHEGREGVQEAELLVLLRGAAGTTGQVEGGHGDRLGRAPTLDVDGGLDVAARVVELAGGFLGARVLRVGLADKAVRNVQEWEAG